MTKTAAIYCRQSRTDERSVSLNAQEAACRALPAVQACEAVEVFTDLSASGGSRYRKQYLALIERIKAKAGDVTVVACFDSDRIARDNLMSAEFYGLMEVHPEIQVELVEGHFDRSPDGELSWTVKQATATHYRKSAGRKMRSVLGYKAARGEPHGMPPYGYRWEGGLFVVHEEQAAVVRRIFEDYSAGEFSAKALALRLNEEGVPRQGARSKHGWLPDTVVDTLRNVAYVGKTTYKGELIKAQWPGIIDTATFKRVQGLMEGRKVRRRQATNEYAFGRLLICARCNQVMRATRTQGHAYYHCRRDVAAPCAAPSVREDVLAAFVNALFNRIAYLDEKGGFTAAMLDAAEKRRKPVRSLASVEAAMENQAKLFAWGHLTEAQYLGERTQLEALRDEILEAVSVPVTSADHFRNLHIDWLAADPPTRRRILGRMFEALYVEDGTVVRYRPRVEHRAEIEAIIERAVGIFEEEGGFRYSAPVTGRKGRPVKRRFFQTSLDVQDGIRGKGGIRTLEGVSHPLSA